MAYEEISREMAEEAQRARTLYPAFNSAHEGYAVLLEEVRELEREVFRNHVHRDKAAMREEAIQIGAMAMRFADEMG